MNGPLLHKLADTFALAKSQVPFYQKIYGGITEIKSFADFAELPIVNRSMLAATSLEKVLSTQQSVCISRMYEDYPSNEDYVPKLLSYDDVVDDHDLLSFFMKPIVTDGNQREKILLICDEMHIYATAELGNQLAFYGWPLTLCIVRNQSQRQMSRHVNWFRPTIIFLDAPRHLVKTLRLDDARCLFTFNQVNGGEPRLCFTQAIVEFEILRDAFAGSVAVKRNDNDYYNFDPESFYFETSYDGTLLVTSLNNRLQPLIRYELSHRGVVTDASTSDHRIYLA